MTNEEKRKLNLERINAGLLWDALTKDEDLDRFLLDDEWDASEDLPALDGLDDGLDEWGRGAY